MGTENYFVRALQFPKEYPELADGCNNVPDSSNRLTSPAPSSEAASPVPRVVRTSVEISTQTDTLSSCHCQSSSVKLEDGTVSMETGEVVEKRRGCPKGGWPGHKKKKQAHAFVQAKIKKLMERAMNSRNGKFKCEMCLMTFKKAFKLRMHLIKSHTSDITEQLSQNADTKPAMSELLPERKSSRIEQKELKEENKFDTQNILHDHLKTENETPLHLQQNESEKWADGCVFNCMVCSGTFTSFEIYKHHIGDNHGLLIEDYRAKYGKLGETINKYTCKICQQDITHKNATIRAHMKSSHNLSLEAYHSKYIKEEKEAEKTQPWYMASSADTQYVCKICNSEMEWNQSAILNHLDSVHQCTLDDYAAKYESGNNNVKRTKWYEGDNNQQYQCMICNGNIAHKFSNISSHLNLLHDLTIQEYEQQYLSINDEENAGDSFAIEGEVEAEQYEFTEADIIIQEEEDGDELDEESMVDGGAESAWYHGSNLTCQICNKQFVNDQWYFHHFSKIHGMTKEQYNEQYGKEMEIWHQYQCLICNSEIRWKYSSIRQHLKQVHSMTIQEYEARYMDAEAEAEAVDSIEAEVNICQDVTATTPITPITNMAGKILPAPPPLKASPMAMMAMARKTTEFSPVNMHLNQKGSLTFDSRPASQWYHGSDLTCEICTKQFVDFTYYCTHIRTVHQISKEQYNEKYGTSCEAFRLYRCLVCGISIKWTYQSIGGHLKSHEMSIKDYENKYDVLENQNTESGKISDLTMNAGQVLVTDDGQPAAKKPKFGDGFSSSVVHRGLERRVFGHKPERISADVSSPTGKWYNQCKFTCKACPEEKYFTVPQALRMHLNGIHNLSRKEYEANYGNAETVTRYWTCLICNKELKCQKGIIIQHLLNVHQMELVDYERQYMDAGDQVVARENRKPRKKRMMNVMKNDSFEGPSDLTHFLVQRMDEGVDNVSLDGPAITEEVMEANGNGNMTSMSTLEVEGMEHVPWYFGCRYSCQICNKFWHYPQAARYHLDSVHKLSRAAYESQYGTCEVETRIFHCSLCQRTMKCERDIIKYHLEAKHQMSLEDYQDQFPNPVVTVGESRRSNAANHARTANVPNHAHNMNKFGSASSSSDAPETELTGGKAPWYRGSSFTCIPCDRNFTAQVSYISHINTKHGMNLKEYREQYGNAEQIKQYICKVPGCTRYVAWTYSGINDHLKSHNMSMAQYEQQYLGIGAGPLASPSSSSPSPTIKKVTVAAAESINEPEDFSAVVDKWANGNFKECQICKYSVGDNEEFSDHLLENHQITEAEYSLQHDTSQHKCNLCGDKIQYKADIIKCHMVDTHGVTIEHYYHKFIGSTNQDATNAEIITASKQQDSVPTIQITSVSTISSTNSIRVRKNHWAVGCCYQCVLCKGQKYPEEFMFKKHILTAHSMTPEEYQNNFGDPALVKQIHFCKVNFYTISYTFPIYQYCIIGLQQRCQA